MKASFDEYDLPPYLKKGLTGCGFRVPSLIQHLTIEAIAEHHQNIVAQSKNGTGKTLAFLLAVFSLVLPAPVNPDKKQHIECIVLSPSRELAMQTHSLISKLTAYASPPIRAVVAVGGQPLKSDIANLTTQFPQILVCSPGRVVHLIKEEIISLENLRTLVLDEADQLFTDRSFKFDLHGLIALLPKGCHKLVYSATYAKSLLEYLQGLMPDSKLIHAQTEAENEEKKEPQAAAGGEEMIDDIQVKDIKQHFFLVQKPPYFEEKLKLLTQVLAAVKFKQCMIFFNQKFRGVEISNHLKSVLPYNEIVGAAE